VQVNHTLDGITSMILASVLRARIRCGSLQARSVNLRNISAREFTPFRTIELMKPPRRRTDRRRRQDSPSGGGPVSLLLWL
jgi:hypothetical protein